MVLFSLFIETLHSGMYDYLVMQTSYIFQTWMHKITLSFLTSYFQRPWQDRSVMLGAFLGFISSLAIYIW